MEARPALFHCERLDMRLTAPGCSRLWLSAQEKENEPKAWEGRSACVTCPIGATNSGRVVSPVAEEVAILKKVCSRCQRANGRIINARHCVSCYNRQAEAMRGKNAKGTRPRLSDQIREVDVAIFAGDGIEICCAPGVIGAAEFIMHRAQHAETVVSFGWVASGPGDMVGLSV